MNMKTFEIQCRNNSDARRMGAFQIAVSGGTKVKHVGGKRVTGLVTDETKLKAWCEARFEVDSYTIKESE